MTRPAFLQSQISSRAWAYWVFVGLFLAAALFLLSHVVRAWDRITFAPEQLPGIVFTGIMILGFSTISVLLLWAMVFRPITTSRIDEEGITINTKTIPWSEIGALYPSCMSSGLLGGPRWSISFHLRSSSFMVVRRDVFMPPVGRDEYRSLIEPIADYLSNAHPHVIVRQLD